MSGVDALRLILLAAIWGGSFLFMKVAAPVFGPVSTACLRLLIAGVALTLTVWASGRSLGFSKNFRQLAWIGVFNSGIPFLLFSYAALKVPASTSVVMNATTPFSGAVFAWIMTGQKLTRQKTAGMLLGIVGVAWIMDIFDASPWSGRPSDALVGAAACLVAAACYGWAGVYIKSRVKNVPPLTVAAITALGGGLALAPFALWTPPPAPPSLAGVGALLALGLLCSAVAFGIYFELLGRISAVQALSVTFLMPPFGIVWGALFLGEQITPRLVTGSLLILAGVGLIALHREPQARRRS